MATDAPGTQATGKASIEILQKDGLFGSPMVLKINPNTLTLEKSPKYAEIAIPGLDAPIQQFIRGQAETLTVDLFFDSSDSGMDSNATSVTEQTDQFYSLVKVASATHAPPVCQFTWNGHFSGDTLKKADGSQLRFTFVGVVSKIKQVFSLFNPKGVPLRATLSLTITEYRPLDKQLQELGLMSVDHTRSHVVADGETLSSIAWDYLDDPTRWRHLADKNAIDDPRRIAVGSSLVVPAILPAGVS
jgi:nucleoid-associated protein YgaU